MSPRRLWVVNHSGLQLSQNPRLSRDDGRVGTEDSREEWLQRVLGFCEGSLILSMSGTVQTARHFKDAFVSLSDISSRPHPPSPSLTSDELNVDGERFAGMSNQRSTHCLRLSH